MTWLDEAVEIAQSEKGYKYGVHLSYQELLALAEVVRVARGLTDSTDNAERNANLGDLYNALARLDKS